MRLALLLLAVRVLSAQPIPAQAVLKGTPPGGVGAACNSTTGYLTAAGQYVSCVSSIWTAAGGGSANATIRNYQYHLDGGGIALSTGATICRPIPEAMTLTAVRLQACNGLDANGQCNAAGSFTAEVFTSTNATYASSGPPGSTIKGSGAAVSVSSAYAANGTITGWTTSISANTTACVKFSAITALFVDVFLIGTAQ